MTHTVHGQKSTRRAIVCRAGSDQHCAMDEARATQHPPPVSLAADTDFILGELRALRDEVPVDPDVCVAILDGPVDLSHPCFQGARLRRVQSLVTDEAGPGLMSAHGTHVASVVFGQPFTGTLGLAPKCRGLAVQVFRDSSGHLSQLDLARAIERAVGEGADVINISGGELVAHGEPAAFLARAIDLCERSGVLVVAATGNDGCACLHVPAALPTVLAVGALGRNRKPVPSSNFGSTYASNGVLAPGEAIPGAVPGGAIEPRTGSSFATPIVSALAALLVSERRRLTGGGDLAAVREAIQESTIPCVADPDEDVRCLGGILNVRGAHALITQGGTLTENDVGPARYVAAPGGATASPLAGVVASGASAAESGLPPMDPGQPPRHAATAEPVPLAGPPAATPTAAGPAAMPEAIGVTPAQIYSMLDQIVRQSAQAPAMASPAAPTPAASASAVGPSGVGGSACSCGGAASQEAPPPVASHLAPPPPEAAHPAPLSLVYALGNIGFDFATEARRDTFRQLMDTFDDDQSPPVTHQPNPYDARQLAEYLEKHKFDSTKLIWTMDLELQPIYAIEAEVTYHEDVYERLRYALKRQVLPPQDPEYVSRVSLPGVLTNRTVRLFSGQVVPVIVVQRRGFFAWNEAKLVDHIVEQIDIEGLAAEQHVIPADLERRVRIKLRQLLDKIYFQLRNLGTASPDRAINFMGTNAIQFAQNIADGILSGKIVDGAVQDLYTLDTIDAVKSPFCRIDSDCWDVRMIFFDPTNDQRARTCFQITCDVSDELPVQLSPTHQFLL
jgi:cyanobactin maturation PatA/PatG family protease